MVNKFKCNVCGYIYDPEQGEPKTKIDPGTVFDDLPELWRCPSCGAGKIRFLEIR